jgi:hypothetical protein
LRDVNVQLAVRASESSTLREFIAQVVLGNKQVEGHMTRFRNLALGGLAALAIGGVASTAFAEEPGSFYNRLNGATIGLPLGAAAPAGLYTGLETAYLGWPGSGSGNQGVLPTGVGGCTTAGGCKLNFPAIAQAVPLLWSTGWNFLGASYSVAAVAAFYEVQVTSGSQSLSSNPVPFSDVQTIANVTWTPISLSWNLGNGWFVSAGFNFMAPIGTNYPGTTNPDYWTYEPTLAVSYLANNWVLSANMFFDFNGPSGGQTLGAGYGSAGYVSGDLFYGDFTAAYKIGKWEIGPVAYVEYQFSDDVPGGGVPCTYGVGGSCGHAENFGLGGLVGYDFGPVDLQVWVTDSVYRQDQIDGLNVWTRLGFRLWAPEAAKPLVAKN